ncbi:MAG: hypothetical protein AAF685_17740 [Cyanobacteria bacterium P01_C01_bin.89]
MESVDWAIALQDIYEDTKQVAGELRGNLSECSIQYLPLIAVSDRLGEMVEG